MRPGVLEQLADEELVARCAAGEERAWATLVQRYRRLVYAIPSRAGLEPEEADDVFQLTFARLVERLDTLRDPARVRSWLVTTARRLSLDIIRRRRGVDDAEPILARVADENELPDSELERLEAQHLVRAALATISKRCRALVELLYYARDETPSYETIAAKLSMPVGSIGPTRARCLQKLLAAYHQLAGD